MQGNICLEEKRNNKQTQ